MPLTVINYKMKKISLFSLSVLFFVQSSSVEGVEITATKITVDMSSLSEVDIKSYADRSRVQCAFLSHLNTEYHTFCVTSDNECLLLNLTFPHGFNDESTDGTYDCYTTEEPLIDYEAIMLTCGTPCCPPPFEDITNVGCVYGVSFLFGGVSFNSAKFACRSYWPGAELYFGEITSNPEWKAMLNRIGMISTWVGAYKDSSGNWIKTNGDAVTNSEWYTGQQNFFPLPLPDLPPAPVTGDGDCGLILETSTVLVHLLTSFNTDKMLHNGDCNRLSHYIC